ncbi:hypothetical protein CIL03_00600 [Virgibacillus indicus]|uniref:Uncharacterized protein n=1 Tax=Virgibacillus indicus TaxID=2024554 RepID=A0A265NCD7_9BACI|nr:hypothetical protein [Virgibacillus indicus]OZU89673.1 hypothetical protein CIL03_00600 [Virgibacillus indicus]
MIATLISAIFMMEDVLVKRNTKLDYSSIILSIIVFPLFIFGLSMAILALIEFALTTFINEKK